MTRSPSAQCIDTGLDRGPDEVADEACYDTEYHTHDRYETCAGEECQGLGQNLFIELITGESCQETCKDTAEHTHLQGLDTQSRCDRAVLDIGADASVSQDGAVDGEQYIHGGQHDQIEDRSGKNRYTLFLLGHAERDCQREDQSQVAEYSVACSVEQLEEHVQNAARMQNSGQTVGRDRCRICK